MSQPRGHAALRRLKAAVNMLERTDFDKAGLNNATPHMLINVALDLMGTGFDVYPDQLTPDELDDLVWGDIEDLKESLEARL